MASSFTFNSINYSGASYGLTVVSHNGPFMPVPRVNVEPLSAANGVVTQGAQWNALTIQLVCRVAGSSKADALTKVANIIAALKTAHEAGEHDFILDDYSGDTYTARLTSGMAGARLGITGAEFTLTFICSNPWPS